MKQPYYGVLLMAPAFPIIAILDAIGFLNPWSAIGFSIAAGVALHLCLRSGKVFE